MTGYGLHELPLFALHRPISGARRARRPSRAAAPRLLKARSNDRINFGFELAAMPINFARQCRAP